MVFKEIHAALQVRFCLFCCIQFFTSFENAGDYIMDVGWSPVHPALFASADLTGKLAFWNLNTDTEVCTLFLNRLNLPSVDPDLVNPSGHWRR